MTSTRHSHFMEGDRDHPHAWESEVSRCEQRKLAITVACLPRIRYRSAFEVGRSVGTLTELLAVRCDRLLSSDITPSSPHRADARFRPPGAALIGHRSISDQWPSGLFDLVVLNEVASRLDEKDLSAVMARVLDSTRLGAHILGVHSRGLTDYPLYADRGHRIMADRHGLVSVVHHVEEQFVLDIWERW
jgi:hypothetical protein